MKTLISTLIFISFSISTYSQTTLKESQKISTFCKIWGFLKYYHPTVAKGKLDWDNEFTTRIKSLTLLNSKQEMCYYYSKWIDSLGKVEICKKCKDKMPDSLKFNLDLTWLNDSTVFTNDLIKQLQYIKQNRNQGKNYYVQQNKLIGNTSYENEKSYLDSIFPSTELRLLGLSRYWNAVNYFFPYKYRIGRDWNEVLIEMIPKFKDSKDTISYQLAMLELTTKINDSHARFITSFTNKYFGIKWTPFKFKIIDNKAIVTDFYDDSICKINDIKRGDVFLSINNESIEKIIKEKSKYIGASNEATRLRNFYNVLFNGNIDSLNVSFERNGITMDKVIHRYDINMFKYNWDNGILIDKITNDYYINKSEVNHNKINPNEAWRILNGNIGYVNLGLLQPEQVQEMKTKLNSTIAIIFDVRNFPNGTMYKIADFLNNENRPFVKFAIPDIAYPGVYHYTASLNCGKKNYQSYKGKIILIFNETSQSHAEFTIMALQTSPNVTSVGSQTAGADGNTSSISFPGGYRTNFTGIGVYYPDGRETQRVGIIPDIEVKPTIDGLKLGKDEVLEKAIETINRK